MCSVSFVGSSSTVATFLIFVPLSKSCTVTLNSTVLLSSGFNVSSIPVVVKSANSYVSCEPSTTILPSTNVVPVGIVSFTIAVSGAVPSFLTVIVYVISSPASTVSPLGGTDVFSPFTSALFTISVTGSVGSLSTTAVFTIFFLNSPSGRASTVTSKLNVISPLAFTNSCIP